MTDHRMKLPENLKTVRKELVKAAYIECEGNLAATERLLRRDGNPMARKTITSIVDELGLERTRKPRKRPEDPPK